MSVPLVVNGVSFNYPVVGDENWGPDATGWASAVTTGMLQKAGGSFTLTADVNFGTSFGLIAQYFRAQNGSSTIPSFAFNSDTDTGLYRVGANRIGFAANGSQIAEINTTQMLSVGGTPGSPQILYVQNTDGTDPGSHAQIAALATGPSGGDAHLRIDNQTAGINWTIGADRSDSNTLKIQPVGAIGTNTQFFAHSLGSVGLGRGLLATTATDGFAYLSTTSGTPTGNSTDFTGYLPFVFDTATNKLWVNTTGTTWLSVTFT